MPNSTNQVEELLQQAGIRDFDELTAVERETYFQMLEVAESGKITLDDFRKHVKRMRESVEFALATEEYVQRLDIFYKARLKCYILFEAFFEKPQRAKEMLEQYGKRIKKT